MALTDRSVQRTIVPFFGGVATTLFGVLFVYAMSAPDPETRRMTIEIHSDGDMHDGPTIRLHPDHRRRHRLHLDRSPDHQTWEFKSWGSKPFGPGEHSVDPDQLRDMKWELLRERDLDNATPHDLKPLQDELRRLRERLKQFESETIELKSDAPGTATVHVVPAL